MTISPQLSEQTYDKSSWNSLYINADKLTSDTFVHKLLFWTPYCVWFPNTIELYNIINQII